MARRLSIIVTLASALVLTGCSPSLPFLPLPLLPGGPAALDVGTCLAKSARYDSDRTSVVPCTEPHLYDVTGTEEWPEMADAIAEFGAGEVFDGIVTRDPQPPFDDYVEWAEGTCSDAFRTAIGWQRIEVGGFTANELRLAPGGAYFIDLSLASRDAFVAGDHSTLCAVAWIDAVAYDDAQTDIREFLIDFPISTRDCYLIDEDYLDWAECGGPHTDQTVLTFDGAAVFGDDLRRKSETYSDDEWTRVGDFCYEAVAMTFPRVAWDEDLYVWPTSDGGTYWETIEDEPEGRYFFMCEVSAMDDSLIEGDAFEGDLVPTGVAASSDDATT